MSPYIFPTPSERSASTKIQPSDFDVTENGFLPSNPPLQSLPYVYYRPWEHLATELSRHVKEQTFRQEADKLPILSTQMLHKESEWRRAYVLLAFFTHAYIWGGNKPAEILPPAITIPFLAVSEHLELPPVATYAALCLWNYTPAPGRALSYGDADSISMSELLTGTEDEAWFYLVSVMVEAQGARSIPLMLDAIQAAASGDREAVTEALIELRHIIQHLGSLLERMYERCKPSVFYHEIRPMLAGSKNMAAAGLPKGVFYNQGEGTGEWLQYRGGSNAQSSLIQFFDAVLGVVHRSTGEAQGKLQPTPFHEEMRHYMPGPHRRFLERVSEVANIQQLAMDTLPASSSAPFQAELRAAFEATVKALSDFRGIHMQIVARYIIVPSRQAAQVGRMNLAVASARNGGGAGEKASYTGTGGTDLVPFLKQTREETEEAAR